MIKNLLGKIPYTADLYDAIRPVRPRTRYNLGQLEKALPAAVEQVKNGLSHGFAGGNGQVQHGKGRKIILFATLHYWVEQAAIIGLALRGMGHDVTIAYLPYSDWDKPINAFDLRRQDLYTRRVLAAMKGLVRALSLLDMKSDHPSTALGNAPPILPGTLPLRRIKEIVESASAFDTMYTLQQENFDRDSALYKLRLERNEQAALAALRLLQDERPETVL